MYRELTFWSYWDLPSVFNEPNESSRIKKKKKEEICFSLDVELTVRKCEFAILIEKNELNSV